MIENYIATHLIDVAALAILCYLIYSNNILNQNRKWPFYIGIMLTVLIISSEAGTIIAGNANGDLRFLNIFCNVFGFAMSPLIPIILLAIYDVNILLTNKLLMLPSIVNMFATALSPWLGFVFYIDVNNHYERGNLFIVFVTAYILNLIILFISTVRTGQKHHYPIKAKFTALSLFVIAGTSIQLIFPSVYSSWHSVTLSLLLYYLLLSEFDGSFDALTRLHNRAAYDKMVNRLDGRKLYSVIVMDINNFKEINDTFGHDFGDTVLKKVASVIRKSFDNSSTCYRVGGDEFYIISSETDPVKLEHQLKCMTNNLEKERKNDGRLPTVSYGYSIFKGGKGIGFQEVLKEADDQMYYFKKIQQDMKKSTQTS
ncbi:GGDEF domain-containing protein [Dehalobacterium formicoaceticum]|uniref:GGDEF domain-containing protein n=1 Tax=Dehalobacterium formicoaceticum TaxID=51515 RepID=A0ABT1Y275_9FIRM|nr:GGDEF domain-containing protein [Dehalobacterium formicoaceticum]MCR6544285.1 GGDEF domain-containing protein [Dehalobacterium formicoaceticum]